MALAFTAVFALLLAGWGRGSAEAAAAGEPPVVTALRGFDRPPQPETAVTPAPTPAPPKVAATGEPSVATALKPGPSFDRPPRLETAMTPAPTPAQPKAVQSLPSPLASAGTGAIRPTGLRRTKTAEPLPAVRPRCETQSGPSASSPLTPLQPVRNCYLAPLRVGLGCEHLNTTQGFPFGLNEYGQETTGKRECLKQMRLAGGDSFMFSVGWCQVWHCGSRGVLRASAGPDVGPPLPEPWRSSAERVAFRGFHGGYVAVDPDQGGNLHSYASDIGVWSRFWLIRHQDGNVSLATHEGHFVGIHQDFRLFADQLAITATEKFHLDTYPDGRVSLRSAWGGVLSAQPSGFLISDRPLAYDWEKFTMTVLSSSGPGSPAPAPAPPAGASVFSAHCEYQESTGGPQGSERRAPIFVKLMEWNYPDIARECQEFLGPNGFDAVQISPVVEHVLGPQWWTKYQAVSYGLNGRSGSAEELRAMVAACRAAGVEVMVDVLLNHMASPCTQARQPEAAHATPCAGWNGSRYGNRRREGARGWDAASPEHFHHRPGDPMRNCAVGPATGWLCGSPDMRDCSCCLCDMYGMPDWNTSIPSVREATWNHLQELNDMGVTMLRIDAAIYESALVLSNTINTAPWDYIYQEWWGEYPVADRTALVGHYRDVAYREKVTRPMATQPPEELPALLGVSGGVFGLEPEFVIYPFAYHDGRTAAPDPFKATYKNGLEYHQQQRYFLAAPMGITMLLWGGYSWRDLEEGPPGCEPGQERCTPEPVFDERGQPRCMPTPTESPLAPELARSHRWVCEHRWAGVAGLVHFRKACRGLPRTETWVQGAPGVGRGNLAFRQGESCFVALVRGYNRERPLWGHMGNWSLVGLATGLPGGRYCDLASLPTQRGWARRSCPREVELGAGGAVLSGEVPEGDILAIHAGARLLEA